MYWDKNLTEFNLPTACALGRKYWVELAFLGHRVLELQTEAPRCRADPILARVLAFSYLSLLIQLDIGPSLLAFLSSLCGAIDSSVGL